MKRKIIVFSSLIVFIMMFLLYKFDLLTGIDNGVYNLIIGIKSNTMTNIMKFITFFGSTKFIIILMIIFLLLSIRYKKWPIIINIVIIGEVIINNLVKIIVRRDRPKLINLVVEKTYSFPSGHTMVSVVLYGLIIYLVSRSKIDNKIKKFIICFLSILIFLIMISRIYLGAHFFSDVLAGFSLALAYLFITIEVIERKKI